MSRTNTLYSGFRWLSLILLVSAGLSHAQGFGSTPLGEGPWIFQTAQAKIQVSVVARGLVHPWSLAFLPDGDILVTERSGQLRLVHNGIVDPEPVAGVPDVNAAGLLGLMDVLPHPEFATNHLLYLSYNKKISDEPKASAIALGLGTLDGKVLKDFKELLVTDSWDGAGAAGARLVFGTDGKLYMGTGATRDGSPQQTDSLRGKVLRLDPDGSVPADNPFIGTPGYAPEIYSLGHRNPSGMAVSPATGQLWSAEYGPNGGDELNIIEAGKNYGWPVVSYGRDYSGPFISTVPYREGMEGPVVSFIPGISPSGLAFYTGTDFQIWTTSVFTGALRVGQIPGTGHLVRIFLDAEGNERQREALLTQLNQRVRDVKMGPDGLLYVLTEEQDGAVLVIKPAPQD